MNYTFCTVLVDTYDIFSIEVGDMYHRLRHVSKRENTFSELQTIVLEQKES